MFWHYTFYTLLTLFGLLIVLKPNLFVQISKYSKKETNDEFKTKLRYLLQVLGGIVMIISIILMFELI